MAGFISDLSGGPPTAAAPRTRLWAAWLLILLPIVGIAGWLLLGNALPRDMEIGGLGRPVTPHRIPASGPLLILALLTTIFSAELVGAGWRRSSLRKVVALSSRSVRADVVIFLAMMSHVLSFSKIVLTLGLVTISGVWLRGWLVRTTGLAIDLSRLPFLADLCLCYLAYTFLDYWAHRLGHSRYFWPLHRFHHAAEDFCVLTAWRVHPADMTGFVVATLPLLLLGASTQVLAALGLILIYVRVLVHSRIPGDLGLLGRTVLQSPGHHYQHHVQSMVDRPARNLSLFPIWDRLFGTWCDDLELDSPIGVHYAYRQGAFIVPDLWRDYREFAVGIGAAVLRGLGFPWAQPGRGRVGGDANLTHPLSHGVPPRPSATLSGEPCAAPLRASDHTSD